MVKYKIKVLGVSELKKKGCGEIKLHKDFVLRYSGVDKRSRAKQGVEIIVCGDINPKLINWKPINPRMISTDIELEERFKIIQIYAPTIDADVKKRLSVYNCKQKHQKQGREVLM
jgi:hypothetical protein